MSNINTLDLTNLSLESVKTVEPVESNIQVANPTHLIISSNYVMDPDTFNSEISQLIQICHKKDIEILIGGSGNHLLIEENRFTTIELKNMADLFNYFKVVMES